MRSASAAERHRGLFVVVSALLVAGGTASAEPELSQERLVLQTSHGDLVLGFYPNVAPATVAHILEVARLGGYDTNHVFRVDRGFVAQVADAQGGRTAPASAAQRALFAKTVPGEFSDIKHVRGKLSMARWNDPDSGTSSFSILLGNAPHLDRTYAVFGELVAGDDVLRKLEALPTKREGIFVMPTERIGIVSSYVYEEGGAGAEACEPRLASCLEALQGKRQARLP